MTPIREGRPADRARLRAIQAAALDHPWPDLLSVAVDGPPELLVYDDGGPVGYALVVPDHPIAYLAELAVAPAEQGRGIGTQLLSTLFERLRAAGFETVRLTARADDERVRGFYDKLGFSEEGRLPEHYDDGDGVLLTRQL
ncbi:GNAT family N-acetyltransferase [Halomicroarcula sp. GCM10025709]|uniref:GNAT family N-acetyltransferase n=1 Tax=Haloarcula TaxID=2237 RepID=UPI0024C244EE|nr:N-acetyltransferase [Halomicroarcula sp. YJ-61-S]